MTWLNILRNLLYPDKFKKHDPVKILNADYYALSNHKMDEKERK